MKNSSSILFALIVIFFLFSCNEPENNQKEHTKSEWLTDFFSEVKTYPDISAVSYWHENFDTTYFRLDSSDETLTSFQSLIQDSSFGEECVFEDQKLIPIVGEKYFGSFPDFCGEEDCVSSTKIGDYETLIDKDLSWVYFSNNWNETLVFPEEAVTTIVNANRVPFIRLLPRSEFEAYRKDPIWDLMDIINGIHDEALVEWAIAAKNTEVNLLVEFGTEVNGSWFSWNGLYYGGGETDQYGDPSFPDGPEIFRDAYRHIISICDAQEADNITWFYHFDVSSDPQEEWNNPVYYYPGDAYIDWLGVSTYGPYSKTDDYEDLSPSILLEQAHDRFLEISTEKPYAVLEFGCTEL